MSLSKNNTVVILSIFCLVIFQSYAQAMKTGWEHIPQEIQGEIVAHIADDYTLGSLSLVDRKMGALILHQPFITSRQQILRLHHDTHGSSTEQYNVDGRPYFAPDYIYNKRGSSLMITANFTVPNPPGYRLGKRYVGYLQLCNDAPGNVRFGEELSVNLTYDNAAYFNTHGKPCTIEYRYSWKDDEQIFKEHSFNFAPNNALTRTTKTCYIDFENGSLMQPVGKLDFCFGGNSRGYGYINDIVQSKNVTETADTKIYKISGVTVQRKPMSKTAQKMLCEAFTWRDPEWFRAIGKKCFPFPITDSLKWAIFAAQGGNRMLYKECLKLYNGPKDIPEDDYDFAQRCSIDDTEPFRDYLDNKKRRSFTRQMLGLEKTMSQRLQEMLKLKWGLENQ